VLEKSIVNAISAHLKTLPDCFSFKEHGGMYGHAGLPDIICCVGGRFVAFEVKAPGGKTTGLQEATLYRIRNAGGAAHVVRSLEEAKGILAELKGGPAHE